MRLGGGLEAAWMRLGCGLDAAWMRLGCGLDATWMRLGCGLEAALLKCSVRCEGEHRGARCASVERGLLGSDA
eukprot:1566140-Pleurochrysis_carterae.AAC.1